MGEDDDVVIERLTNELGAAQQTMKKDMFIPAEFEKDDD